MNGNTFGQIFSLTTFGESHGAGIGGIIDGCPAGLTITESMLQKELDSRRPGQENNAAVSTSRSESDRIKILSGIFENKTTGTPLAFFIENTNQHSRDYEQLRHIFRPGHADYSYQKKFGLRDYRGGGRSSARETAARVAGGAVALALLAHENIFIKAHTVEFGGIAAPDSSVEQALHNNCPYPFFAPDRNIVEEWLARVAEARSLGDTLGGIVQIVIQGVPAGLGEPVFDGLDARLAAAVLSVGAVKGIEFGAGFKAARMLGSEHNDILTPEGFCSNNAGGILGGISSGQDIVLKAAIKPIPSIGKTQQALTDEGIMQEINIGGRHDLSPIPRIVPVLKAMAALTLADFLLLQRRMNARNNI